ncbi:MAG: hypothetical protein KC996_01090 [Phycisphaerales bacterium]|nr:hypothetical protein [Phycisphaerales bacterium]
MPADGPTTLLLDDPGVEPAHTQSSMIPVGLVVSGVVLMLIAGVVLSRRRARKMDPRELAFRTIVQKLGYSRSQIKAVRQAAIGQGLSSPVGIVMNPSVCEGVMAGVRNGR